MFLLVSGQHVVWAAWRLLTNLFKCGKNICSYILYKKNCSDLNLGGSRLCIFTFFLFPYSGIYLLNGFDFVIYFEWPDTVIR